MPYIIQIGGEVFSPIFTTLYLILFWSACYAFQKKWDLVLQDAVLCLSRDPKSVKGYYRLAQAQIELSQLDDAEATIIAALKIDPGRCWLYST